MRIEDFNKISDLVWEIPKSFRKDMKVSARVFASEKILKESLRDASMNQLVNTATLPGVQKYVLAMPDVHEGYGAPIGGVFATQYPDGLISPGAVGYDLNCGIRILKSDKSFDEVKPELEKLADAINKEVPSGVGRSGRLKLNDKELDEVLSKGARKIVEDGYGEPEDLKFIESQGELEGADASKVSFRAKDRGRDQLGTMGAGNHFVEVARIDELFDEGAAKTLGLFKNQTLVQIHTGSRGFGHQIATDYIKIMLRVMPKYGIILPDRELAGSPFDSKEGQDYFKAMSCGANFAWANRQLITWEVRKAWQAIFGKKEDLRVVYDIAHNLAKIEDHQVDGRVKKVIVHRKGATRAFPGQPVLIPGSMGTSSYILIGRQKAMEQSFGSSCHGAGRIMSRHAALRQVRGGELKKELEARGIAIRSGSWKGLAEESPVAYKDIEAVVDVVSQIGIAKKVARLKPIAVIKG